MDKNNTNDTKHILDSIIKEKDIVRPLELAKTINVSSSDIYDYMSEMEEKGLFVSILSPYCDHCGRYKKKIYRDVWDAKKNKDDLKCPVCGRQLDYLEDMCIVYKRTKKEQIMF